MNTQQFLRNFDNQVINQQHSDTCPGISGHTSPKIQTLLHFAYSHIPSNEAYAEVGALNGKTFVSACKGNHNTNNNYIFDNFSQFGANKSILTGNIRANLPGKAYQLVEGDFKQTMLDKTKFTKIGLYFYDGPHEQDDQRDAILFAEPLLADEALVVIDDWNHVPVKPGTLLGMNLFPGRFEIVKELSARYNGDIQEWWNGIGVLVYKRH